MQLIDTTEELEKACKILEKQKVIAIDCEDIYTGNEGLW